MFMLLGGSEKKARKDTPQSENLNRVKELFGSGKFPVVTTQTFEGRPIVKMLGLVCCRGFDSEEAFFGMAALALKKGAQGIIGYSENVAFHPDGSKYFSCFGTAVMFAREARGDLLSFQPAASEQDYVRFSGDAYAAAQASPHYSRDTAGPVHTVNDGRAEGFDDLSAQPSEEDDPVLQRLLASQRRVAGPDWQ